ncbi:cobalt ECF transporter T component CbiQ [Prescottella agglutinans]|uniref:Cobalt/nickel transport system permease protein n=1 Tax=Prescottella agglutinans TaxID=1644129 RepID=A0ABT6M7W9_9NOCA|nr:cobalt ECF transporter T component CbiQ [Prescottella agglutinans]MDH6280388.1 cobalt/nickel transport system permease protein [Prescottella agglutinans]
MSGSHTHPLYLEGTSPVHALPTEVKILAAFVGVFAVVATPRESFWAFGLYLLILLVVWRIAGITLRWLAPRMLIELPFVVLAVLLPFAESGDRVAAAGLSLSVPGLLAAWNILVKGTLGVLVSLTLAATTPMRSLPAGLSRLHLPGVVVTVATLMLRYVNLLAGEIDRMRIARVSRGDDPRTLHQVGAAARGVGGTFLRAYERGERVHLAMLSRGFTGTVPLSATPAGRRDWCAALTPAACAVAIATTAWMV